MEKKESAAGLVVFEVYLQIANVVKRGYCLIALRLALETVWQPGSGEGLFAPLPAD
jgi:hypothetical protein